MLAVFVLDASVAVCWALHDGSKSDRIDADLVLDCLGVAWVLVLALWCAETVCVLRGAEEGGVLEESA